MEWRRREEEDDDDDGVGAPPRDRDVRLIIGVRPVERVRVVRGVVDPDGPGSEKRTRRFGALRGVWDCAGAGGGEGS